MDRWAWEQLTPWRAAASQAAGRGVVLRATRPDSRPRVGACRCPLTAAPHRCPCGCAATLCAASAAPCARRRDVSRGRALARHPTPTRTCRSRDHLGLPARDRQHRDRPRRPRTPRSDDPGHPRPVDLRPLSLVGRPRTHQARRIGPAEHRRHLLGIGMSPLRSSVQRQLEQESASAGQLAALLLWQGSRRQRGPTARSATSSHPAATQASTRVAAPSTSDSRCVCSSSRMAC